MRDFVDAYMRVTVVMQMTNILSCEKQGNIEQCQNITWQEDGEREM